MNELSAFDYFMGQALSNPTICTGYESEQKLTIWFGTYVGISAAEIRAKQAEEAALALINISKRKL